MWLREPAEINPGSSALRYRIDLLWQKVAFGAWEDNERRAAAIANQWAVAGRSAWRAGSSTSSRMDHGTGSGEHALVGRRDGGGDMRRSYERQ